ncbi:MAG: YdcF family protein [Caulobacteraceae bacterium]
MKNKKVSGIAIAVIGVLLLLYYFVSLLMFWGANILFLLSGMYLLISAGRRLSGKNGIFSILPKQLRKLALIGGSVLLVSFIIIEGLIIAPPVSACKNGADYIIILGSGLRGEQLSLSLKSRLDKGLKYIHSNPGAQIVVTGGQGKGEAITEAEAMKRYLVSKGISGKQIIKEEKSASTYENFKYTKAVLAEGSTGENISAAIVTNDFHIFRSMIIARHLGFEACPLPAATPILIRPNCYVREYFAVIKTLVFDLNKNGTE